MICKIVEYELFVIVNGVMKRLSDVLLFGIVDTDTSMSILFKYLVTVWNIDTEWKSSKGVARYSMAQSRV